jgi:hypothetical protein
MVGAKAQRIFFLVLMPRLLPGHAGSRGFASYNWGGGASRICAPREDPGSESVFQHKQETLHDTRIAERLR